MCMNIHTNTFKDKLDTWEMTLSSASRLVWFVCVNNIHVCCMYMHSMCFMCMHAIHIAMILSNASRFVLFVRVKINMYTQMCMYIHWSKEPPPPGGVSYLLCSLIKNPEEEDPPRSTWNFLPVYHEMAVYPDWVSILLPNSRANWVEPEQVIVAPSTASVSIISQGLMRLTRLRADSRGTPTARGRQCRMSQKGQEESETGE